MVNGNFICYLYVCGAMYMISCKADRDDEDAYLIFGWVLLWFVISLQRRW
jgi:hypothetical protein